MSSYLSSLSRGILLESYDLFFEWGVNLKRFLDEIKHIDVITRGRKDFNYCGYTIKSKFLGSSKSFNVTFNFINDKFSSVNISDDDFFTEPADKYEFVQNFLISRIGEPLSFKSKPEENISIWKFNKLKICHSLIDTFGLREILEIRIV